MGAGDFGLFTMTSKYISSESIPFWPGLTIIWMSYDDYHSNLSNLTGIDLKGSIFSCRIYHLRVFVQFTHGLRTHFIARLQCIKDS